MCIRDRYKTVSEICSHSSYEGLEAVLEAIDKAKQRLDANVNTELALELMLLTMKEN